MCLQYILIRFTPPSFFLIPCPLSQNHFSKFHCSIFIYECKIHPPYLPSLFILPFLLVPIPRQDPFYLPILHFFKCILTIQGGIALVFQMCLSNFNQINLLYYFLFFYFPVPLLFKNLQCIVILSSYTDTLHFNIIYSLSFSFPLLPLPYSPFRQTH
jgi:hypothetical protein